jgi:subtilisin family serine protease
MEASRKGVWVFAAAGNDGSNRVGYPANYRIPGLFSVSAIDERGQLARFSNYGKVEMAAPGVNTLSTMPGNKYGRMSGTSMATPIAAGVGAMYKSVNKQIKFQDMGDKVKFGYGLPVGDGL